MEKPRLRGAAVIARVPIMARLGAGRLHWLTSLALVDGPDSLAGPNRVFCFYM